MKLHTHDNESICKNLVLKLNHIPECGTKTQLPPPQKCPFLTKMRKITEFVQYICLPVVKLMQDTSAPHFNAV